MKVGIMGSYGGGSIGDEAILKGLLNVLEESSQNIEEVLIYTSNKSNTLFAISQVRYKFKLSILNWDNKARANEYKENKERKQSLPRNFVIKSRQTFMKSFPSKTLFFEDKIRKILKKPFYQLNIDKDIDVLICGGGNILMDLYPQWALFLENVLEEVKLKNMKLLFLGVGAGPINTSKGKEVICDITQNYYVSTRDKQSLQILNELSPKKKSKQLYLNTDLAFGLASESKKYNEKKDGIAVTAVPYYASYYWPTSNNKKYENYCLNIARIFDEFVKTTDEKITFFATNYPSDITVAEHIKEKMKNKNMVEINNIKMNVNELLDFCGNKKFVIGSRLHSLILSSCVGTNFFAINYQPKVNYFLDQIGKKENYIDIKTLEKDINDQQIKDISDVLYKEYKTSNVPSFALEEKKKLINEMNLIL